MTAVIQVPKNRKNSTPSERANVSERDRTGSKLSATLRWLANNPIVRLDEQVELILVTWHPLIIEDSYCDDDLSAQRILDQTIRKNAPRSTMVCGGHRVWWLISSGKQSLKLKNLKGRIERAALKQSTANPLFEKLGDSLIVQRIGCWTGPTTASAKGLAGIFADMAAGQAILDNFGLPFERQHTSSTRTRRKNSVTKTSVNSQPQHTKNKSKKNTLPKPRGSAWIHSPSIPFLGQYQATPSHLSPMLQIN